MPLRATEAINDAGQGLDLLPHLTIAQRLADAQTRALAALSPVLEQITQAADMMATALHDGGALIYGAAGSSGLMAAADALELPGTFGIPASRIRILMAGGQPSSSLMPGTSEDDTDEAARVATCIRAGDCLIVLSASGATPYALALARAAQATGARVIAIANTADAALFAHADLAICLATPPELLAGSTRLGAGTAQKAALNTMSTLMAVKLGHVHDGMMVNLRVDNAKLRSRAARMVATIAQVPEPQARAHLQATGYAVKPAVLLASGVATRDQAETLLHQTNGNLRAALTRL